MLHHLVVLRHVHLLIVDILELVLVLELLHLGLIHLVVLIEVHHLRLLKHLLLGLLLLELENRLRLLRWCLLHLERGVAVGRLYHGSIDELVLESLALILILLHHWLLILHRWLLNRLVELRQLELGVIFLFGLD